MSKPEDRFKSWMNSSGHRRNILQRSFKEVGVGVESRESKKGSGDDKRTFYTVEFGTKK
jgi:uncharacterized protein YkwD